MGKEWLRDVEHHLWRARAFIVILTHASANRPWLWFEVGGAWSRKAKGQCAMFVLCTSEVGPLDVPKPLDRLQLLWLEKRGSLKQFAKDLVTTLGFGNAAALRRVPITSALAAARMATDEPTDELATPLQFAFNALERHPTLTFRDGAGDVLPSDIRFDIFARLALTLLVGDRPEDGFTDEYLYQRVWLAMVLIWERNEGGHLPHFDPRDFKHGMEMLCMLGVIHGDFHAMITLLGSELLERWPVRLPDYSQEELTEILRESATLPYPTLEEAEDALERGALEFGDQVVTEPCD